ncbi:MAG: CsbD family protein [Terriglobales bacterium]
MKQSTKDKAKGRFHEMKGKVKEKVGRATNNPELEAEGRVEKIRGKVQKKIGQAKRIFGK